MTFHVFFMYPETVGRSLEEIDMVFETNVKPWHTHKIADVFGEEVERHKDVSAKKDVGGATHEEVV
jgi:hypothetical protein